MPELPDLLERRATGYVPPADLLERVHDRRRQRDRNRRIHAGVLGIAVIALAAVGFVRLLGSEGTPAVDPQNPFAGTWVSTSDGGARTMVVQISADDTVEIVVTDHFDRACAGTSFTVTGTGRIEDGTTLVIPAPVFGCDAGSQIENRIDPPVEDAFRTLVLDPETHTLSDAGGGVWLRAGTERPSPAPAASGQMWPQTSYQEVVEAQGLADAGDLATRGRSIPSWPPVTTSIPGIPRSSSDSSGRGSAGRTGASEGRGCSPGYLEAPTTRSCSSVARRAGRTPCTPRCPPRSAAAPRRSTTSGTRR